MIVVAVSQKGGVPKSALARLIAREYANAGWAVKIADLDISQGTSFNWQARPLQNQIEPVIPVEALWQRQRCNPFGTLLKARVCFVEKEPRV